MRRGVANTETLENISTGHDLVDAIKSVPRDFRSSEAIMYERDLWDLFFSFDECTRFSVANNLAAVQNNVSRILLTSVLKKDPSPLVRHEAAFAIGCVGDEGCLPVLRGALTTDKSFLVRHEVAMALSELGGKGEIRVLKKGLGDRSREVVISCRVAIQRISERLKVEPFDNNNHHARRTKKAPRLSHQRLRNKVSSA
jgi:HEAT repeat protein